MTGHETITRRTHNNTAGAGSQRRHLWPERAPVLSSAAKKLVGKKTSWLMNSLVKRADLGPDGYSAFDRGTLPWGRFLLSWEMRTYDQHLLYRDFGNQPSDDKIRLILVVTAEEAKENLAQEQARRAAQHALYWPPKVPYEQEGQRKSRARTQSASRFRATAQG